MTGRPTDDELREALDSRASRVSPDASRDAMAGLRAAMRGTPDASGGFAVLPVTIGGRGARLPGGIVAVGLVAVILVAVLGGQLTAPKEASSAQVVDTHVPESIPTLAAAGPPSPAVPDEALPAIWAGADLGDALATKSSVGQVVVVGGPLNMYNCNPGGMCDVDIKPFAGIRVVFPRPPASIGTITGSGSQTAFRIRDDGALDYLGEPDANPRNPLTVDGLVGEDSTPGRGLFVSGWLVDRAAADASGLGALPVPAPTISGSTGRVAILSGAKPASSGRVDVARSLLVTLDDTYQQDPRTASTESTFLVSSSGGGWQVDGIVAATIGIVARTSPSPAPTSSVPVISLPVLGGNLTPDDLRSRLADGSLDGRLVVIDGQLQLNGRACGLRIACAIPFISGLDDVQIDTDTEARLALQRAIPPRGPLVFVVHDSVLRYLGRQPADVDHPITVNQLLDTRIPSLIDPSSPVHELTDDPQLVSGWLVIGGPSLCSTRTPTSGFCIGPSPRLTDDRPSDEGALNPFEAAGTAVTLMTDPPLQSTDRVVTEGSFLVRDRSRSPAWVDAPACDASEDVVCSGGQPSMEIIALLGPRSPLHDPLP